MKYITIKESEFQHTAARRRLVLKLKRLNTVHQVSTHSRPKAAGCPRRNKQTAERVSTHSRPKAAGPLCRRFFRIYHGFNTQPPEGGWTLKVYMATNKVTFQHTAARRRLVAFSFYIDAALHVSTHSRPKAAGMKPLSAFARLKVSTHSRPKAAGFNMCVICFQAIVSTHSRPKAAGALPVCNCFLIKRFNTQPPEGGWIMRFKCWLLHCNVSTHSRPKAAGCK